MKHKRHPLRTFKIQVNLLSVILLGIFGLAVVSSWQQGRLTSTSQPAATSYTAAQSQSYPAVEASDLIEDSQAVQEQPAISEQKQEVPTADPSHTSSVNLPDTSNSCEKNAREQAEQIKQEAIKQEDLLHKSKLLGVSGLLLNAENSRHLKAIEQINNSYLSALEQSRC